MTTEGVKCIFTAILSANPEGYSLLMGEDEESIIRILKITGDEKLPQKTQTMMRKS